MFFRDVHLGGRSTYAVSVTQYPNVPNNISVWWLEVALPRLTFRRPRLFTTGADIVVIICTVLELV